jgi:hypothetical protein
MRELRAEAAREREALTVEILASLGRVPSAIDRIAAANLAALHVRANRIEASGRDASAIRQQITQAVRATGFKPQPAAAQKPRTIQEMLAERGIKPPSASPATPEPEQRRDEARFSEAANAHGEVSP